MQAWLAAHADQPQTLRSYRRSAERLLLWCWHERGIGLAMFTGGDAARYLQWLGDLGRLDEAAWQATGWRLPASAWLATGPSRPARDAAAWRPMAGPLSERSLAHERAVIKAMTNHLARIGHLKRRPFDDWPDSGSIGERAAAAREVPVQPGMPGSVGPAPDDGGSAHGAWVRSAPAVDWSSAQTTPAALTAVLPADRSRVAPRPTPSPDRPPMAVMLSPQHWQWLLQDPPGASPDVQARLNAVLWLVRSCGLSAADLLGLRLGDLAPMPPDALPIKRQRPSVPDWHLRVAADTPRQRCLPLPTHASQALLRYLQTVGVTASDLRAVASDPLQPGALQPLFRAQRGRRSAARPMPSAPLRYSTLQASVQRHLRDRAEALRLLDPAAAPGFQQASLRWLRACFAEQALSMGAPLAGLQAVLGHRSLVSTGQYAINAESRRADSAVAPLVAAQTAPRMPQHPALHTTTPARPPTAAQPSPQSPAQSAAQSATTTAAIVAALTAGQP